MGPDEIRGRDDREPWLPSRLRSGVAAAVVLVLGALGAQSVLGSDREAAGPAGPTSTPSTSAPSTSAPPDRVGRARPGVPSSYVSVLAVCDVGTDHRSRLAVRFLLENETGEDITVEFVRPLLPRGGLRPLGTSVVSADCYRWLPGDPDRVIPPSQARMVTLQLGLPPTCPSTLPVQAAVRFRGQDEAYTVILDLLDDLRGISFDTCGSP